MWKPLSGEQSGVSQAGSASGRRGRRGRRTRRAQRIPRVRPGARCPHSGRPSVFIPAGLSGREAGALRLLPPASPRKTLC